MKIYYYCQHILGMGHLFRSLEICSALKGHEVLMLTGGPAVDAVFPDHVRKFRLPGLVSDAGFNGLRPTDPGRTAEDVRRERQALIMELFRSSPPDVFIIELFPFGRNAFRFELGPVLDGIRSGGLPPCRVVCSLRDVLVEKKDRAAYEKRVITWLNSRFDALLVHSDPRFIRLDETFTRLADIGPDVVYTGFVTPRPAPGAGDALRRALGISSGERMIVASAGGGAVGFELLQAAVRASARLAPSTPHRLFVFTGPFMDDEKFRILDGEAGPAVRVERFTTEFLSYLAAADCSVSMAGYNTCLNVLAAGTSGLLYPFAQNHEQRLRVEALTQTGRLGLLEADDLEPGRLAGRIAGAFGRRAAAAVQIDLNGAGFTAEWLERWMDKPWKPVLSRRVSSLYLRHPERLSAGLEDVLKKVPPDESRPVRVFFRADDIGAPGRNFTRLMAVFRRHQTPLALAVVPVWLTRRRWDALLDAAGQDETLWCWHQHGYRHMDHGHYGNKGEFAPGRPLDAVRKDLVRGRDRLASIMGRRFAPVFTPPWNRCSAETTAILAQLGFRAVSRSQGAKPREGLFLPDIPVSVDLHTRKELNPDASRNALLEELAAGLAGGTGVCGIMIHHQRMNEAAFRFLDLLLNRFASHSGVLPVRLDEIIV